MEQEKNNYLIIIAVILLIIAVILGVWFFFFRENTTQNQTPEQAYQTVPRLSPERPRNLIEGYISDTNFTANEITVSLSMETMFANATQPRIEKKVKLNPETRFIIKDVVTEEERVGTIDDIKIWDDVLIFIAERAIEVYDRDFFTAKEIMVFEGSPYQR
ncbi:MAG: hypothetical protein WC987_02760 [Mariniphaga sp.]